MSDGPSAIPELSSVGDKSQLDSLTGLGVYCRRDAYLLRKISKITVKNCTSVIPIITYTAISSRRPAS